MSDKFVVIPEHALLIVEEHLKEHEAEGVEMPSGIDRSSLALKILLLAALSREGRKK